MAVISKYNYVALFTFKFTKIVLGTVKRNISDEVTVMIFSTFFQN